MRFHSPSLLKRVGLVAWGLIAAGFTIFGSISFNSVRLYLTTGNLLVVALALALILVVFEISCRVANYIHSYNTLKMDMRHLMAPSRNDRVYAEHLNEAVAAASKIDCIGISHERLVISIPTETYEELGERRAEIRVLFPRPEGIAIEVRESDEDREAGSLAGRIRHSIQEFQRRARDFSCDKRLFPIIRIRYYDSYPSINLIIIDRRVAFFHPYLGGKGGYDCLSFMIYGEKSKELLEFIGYFEDQWSLAQSSEILLTE